MRDVFGNFQRIESIWLTLNNLALEDLMVFMNIYPGKWGSRSDHSAANVLQETPPPTKTLSFFEMRLNLSAPHLSF